MTRRPQTRRARARAPGRRRIREDHQSRSKSAAAEPSGIEVSNLQSHVRIAARQLLKIVRAVLAAEQVASATLSVVLADNATVRRVNRDFLQHDYDTDVLSFLFESTPAPASEGRPIRSAHRSHGRHLDGEVLASAEMAAQTAGRFGWSARDELTLYLVHGLLHLCGYDDVSPQERRIMRGRERSILTDLGISAPRSAERRRRRSSASNGSVS
jgi:probable rRNA maturation factor